jgi:uncharacterized repeat protein (TIGR03943 family)
VRRDGAAVVLVALGVLGLRLGLTDAMLDYVKPFMRWPLVATSVVLVVLGVWELALSFRSSDRGQDVHDHHDDGHHHHGGAPRVTWLLLVPVIVSLVVAPGALQADAVRRALPADLIPLEELPPLPPPVAGVYDLPLAEVAARSVGPEGELAGLTVRTVGFTVRRGSETSLARFRLNCCAADARVAEVVLVGLDRSFTDDTWLSVEGVWAPSEPGEEHAAILVVSSVTEIERPANPYA